MTVPIPSSQSVVFLGDSTTNGDSLTATSWWKGTGAFADQLNAAVKAGHGTNYGARLAGGARAGRLAGGATSSRTVPGGLSMINGGANGATSATLLANMAALYKNQPVAFISVGINDIQTGVAVGTFTTNLTAILAAIHAGNPNCGIVITTIPCDGEVWSAGPVWGVNPAGFDATIDTFNAAIVAVAAAAVGPCVVCHFRTALLAWEVINNPAKDASGHATQDGIHWTNTGRTFAAPIALASVVVP